MPDQKERECALEYVLVSARQGLPPFATFMEFDHIPSQQGMLKPDVAAKYQEEQMRIEKRRCLSPYWMRLDYSVLSNYGFPGIPMSMYMSFLNKVIRDSFLTSWKRPLSNIFLMDGKWMVAF
jgi:hypothetical protein